MTVHRSVGLDDGVSLPVTRGAGDDGAPRPPGRREARGDERGVGSAGESPFESDVHASLRETDAARNVTVETFHVTFPLHESATFPASA